jgi:hypothetical protein
MFSIYWDCWNCHLLMCSLACCLSKKLMCTLVCKTTPDFISSVWRCKCTCKVEDALAGGLKIKKKKYGSLLKLLGVRKMTLTKIDTHWSLQRHKKLWLLLSLWSCCISQELCNCWWNEQTCIAVLLGPVGWRNIIFVSDVNAVSGTFLVLAFTVHMIHDIKGYRKSTCWSSTEQFHVPFYSDILWYFHIHIEGNLNTDKAGPLENLHTCTKAWSCVTPPVDCLVLSDGAHQMRNSDKLRCLVFCWWWVTKYEVGMCTCVYAHFQFLQPLYSCFIFSKPLTYIVNLFCLCLSINLYKSNST